MEVFLILPSIPQGQMTLRKELARFHAYHAQQIARRFPYPAEQKLELIDAEAERLKSGPPST